MSCDRYRINRIIVKSNIIITITSHILGFISQTMLLLWWLIPLPGLAIASRISTFGVAYTMKAPHCHRGGLGSPRPGVRAPRTPVPTRGRRRRHWDTRPRGGVRCRSSPRRGGIWALGCSYLNWIRTPWFYRARRMRDQCCCAMGGDGNRSGRVGCVIGRRTRYPPSVSGRRM